MDDSDDHVTGGLNLAYVPSQLNLTGDLDPEICTNGLFGVELPPELPDDLIPPIPSAIDLDLSVNDTESGGRRRRSHERRHGRRAGGCQPR